MDTVGQQAAWDELQNSLKLVADKFPFIEAQVAGAPLIALNTSKQTRASSIRLSILAGGLLAMLVLFAYRSWQALLLTALPVVIGVLFAVAISSLIYPVMHVLTMAFGVTLLGLALDYPVHILSHRSNGETLEDSVLNIWPTLRLGVITTLFAFSALVWTDFEGIARLGVFSITGLLSAALVSRYLLPGLDKLIFNQKRFQVTGRLWLQNIRWPKLPPLSVPGISALLIVVAGFLLARVVPWSDDLAALSPVPDELIKQELQLRTSLQLAQTGTQILVHADDLDGVLGKELSLLPTLRQARLDGLVDGWQIAASVLLPASRQQQLQSRLPAAAELKNNLSQAIADTPFIISGFEQFQLDVKQSRELPPLNLDMLSTSSLGEWLSSLLLDLKDTDSGGYAGIVRLHGLVDAAELRLRLDKLGMEGVWLVETRQELSQALATFRLKLTKMLLFSAVLTVLVLLLLLRQQAGRVLGITMVVSAAIIGAAWFTYAVSGSLNLLNLIGLILVAGFGIDYALFFTRPAKSRKEQAATLHALLVCLGSSSIVFILLALSGIRVLESIGVVVASGVILAFACSWLAAASMQIDTEQYK